MKRMIWGWTFLGITGLAILLEVFAAWNPFELNWVTPWTDYVTEHIPVEVAALIWGGVFVAWLPVHFYLAYRRKQDR